MTVLRLSGTTLNTYLVRLLWESITNGSQSRHGAHASTKGTINMHAICRTPSALKHHFVCRRIEVDYMSRPFQLEYSISCECRMNRFSAEQWRLMGRAAGSLASQHVTLNVTKAPAPRCATEFAQQRLSIVL